VLDAAEAIYAFLIAQDKAPASPASKLDGARTNPMA